MITAIIFINTVVDRIDEVAGAVAGLPGVNEVYSVTGELDLIALVKVRDHDEIARVVTNGINQVAGVTSTRTHIAFSVYRPDDVDAAFSLGH